MVWHRDKEDGLILLGWERVETLKSKVTTQEAYSGEEPEKLDHLAARPLNELMDLGPNTAHTNQKPKNSFSPGVRVVKAEDDDPDVAVVVEFLPPEKDRNIYGQTMECEAVRVAFPTALDVAQVTGESFARPCSRRTATTRAQTLLVHEREPRIRREPVHALRSRRQGRPRRSGRGGRNRSAEWRLYHGSVRRPTR